MRTNRQSEHRRWLIFISIVGVITLGGYFCLYPQTLFKPGERLFDFGYNLGLAGGLMMLVLLLYPLRKRVKFFSKMGALPTWFKWHMVLGILGPLTIIFHSTYHVYIPFIHPTGSPNAAVAMLCMLLVSGSGTFGRFFYTKIHHGLYGRQATVNELQAELDSSGRREIHVQFCAGCGKGAGRFSRTRGEFSQEIESGVQEFLCSRFPGIDVIQVAVQGNAVKQHLPRRCRAI